ncbi:MAG: nucleotide exchange factor GrpE [bacterium]|nr:MAG: nucleotide exchange factor GrpE [bacterium]
MSGRKRDISTGAKDLDKDSKNRTEIVIDEGNGGGQEGTAAEGSVTIPLAEYEGLRAAVEDLKDKYLRVAADFDNFRKRMEREREDIICYANERLISDLLPILDNLDRALESAGGELKEQGILEGVRMISGQLHGILERCGLEPVPGIGEPFDPSHHEAVGVLPSGEHKEGTVIAELQRGYKLKGKVVRASMVHVAGDGNGDAGKDGDR